MKHEDFVCFVCVDIGITRNAVWVRRSSVISVKPAEENTVFLLMSSGDEIQVHGKCSDVIQFLEEAKYRPFETKEEMEDYAQGRPIWERDKPSRTYTVEEACELFTFEYMAENCIWGSFKYGIDRVAYDLEWELTR